VVGGASVVQQLLRAGLVDELHVDVIPVLLGGGLRLLENIDPLQLEKIDVREVGARTSLASASYREAPPRRGFSLAGL
jgi:dihydrofolate reductase